MVKRVCMDLISPPDVKFYHWVHPELVGIVFVFDIGEKVEEAQIEVGFIRINLSHTLTPTRAFTVLLIYVSSLSMSVFSHDLNSCLPLVGSKNIC